MVTLCRQLEHDLVFRRRRPDERGGVELAEIAAVAAGQFGHYGVAALQDAIGGVEARVSHVRLAHGGRADVAERNAAALRMDDPQRFVVQRHVRHPGRCHLPERGERPVADRRAGLHELDLFRGLGEPQFFVPRGHDFKLRAGEIRRQRLVMLKRNRNIRPRKIPDDADPAMLVSQLAHAVADDTRQVGAGAHVGYHRDFARVGSMPGDIDRQRRLALTRKNDVAMDGGEVSEVGSAGVRAEKKRRAVDGEAVEVFFRHRFAQGVVTPTVLALRKFRPPVVRDVLHHVSSTICLVGDPKFNPPRHARNSNPARV